MGHNHGSCCFDELEQMNEVGKLLLHWDEYDIVLLLTCFAVGSVDVVGQEEGR